MGTPRSGPGSGGSDGRVDMPSAGINPVGRSSPPDAGTNPVVRASATDGRMSPVVTHLERDESTITLLRELVAHLRQNRTQLREEWARLITEERLLSSMSPEEVVAEATAVYDNYLEPPDRGSIVAVHSYPRDISERTNQV